jgi:Collagen triple helix repeat (20 copies)
MKKSMAVLAAVFLVLAVSSGAFAAKGLLTGADIQDGSLTGADIKEGSLGTALFTSSAKNSLHGPRGSIGPPGAVGLAGIKGTNGTNGLAGIKGVDGTNGLAGSNGTNGTNGLAGIKGVDGTNGLAGSNGTNGTNGTNGSNGTVTPLSATAGLTLLPTASPLIVVIYLDVPAGTYVILAKTQLAHSGAGDSIHCNLKAGTATVDQIDMKTLPALAAVPVSLQAVTTVTSSSRLSVECAVLVASGTASFSSLIAIPTS